LVSPLDDRRKGRQRLLNKPESKCRLAWGQGKTGIYKRDPGKTWDSEAPPETGIPDKPKHEAHPDHCWIVAELCWHGCSLRCCLENARLYRKWRGLMWKSVCVATRLFI
jgi:hypothetical protein